MVDEKILASISKIIDEGPKNNDDFLKIFEYIKEISIEDANIKKKIENLDISVQLIIPDSTGKFWLTFKEGKMDYGVGQIYEPSCTAELPTSILASLIQGEIDGPSAYMAGKIDLKGNVADWTDIREILIETISLLDDLI
ncbi:MAG: SCP2 sterol-binding domain-containing protein [Promethearchaeota archaeon]